MKQILIIIHCVIKIKLLHECCSIEILPDPSASWLGFQCTLILSVLSACDVAKCQLRPFSQCRLDFSSSLLSLQH